VVLHKKGQALFDDDLYNVSIVLLLVQIKKHHRGDHAVLSLQVWQGAWTSGLWLLAV
jgi:cytochrome bd-type quinol oxidase subunit 1